MKLRLSTFAIALVVVANALVLAGVAWNRSGEPGAVLELTERELALPYGRWASRESTGVTLSFRRADQDHEWLDRAKLDALGFDVDGFDKDSRRGWRAQERRLFVVLEYDGAAFAALVAEQEARLADLRSAADSGEAHLRQIEAAESRLERLRTAESRLVVIDAGTDAGALRQRYPDPTRYVVMRALLNVHATFPGAARTDPVLRGRVSRLLPGNIYLPRRFHESLRRATDEGGKAFDAPPRYRAEVRWGRRQEPWITAIEAMAAP